MGPQSDLSQKQGDTATTLLTGEALASLRVSVPDWGLVIRKGTQHLERTFSFPDFAQALAFTNAVGELAETLDHHPRIVLEWGAVKVSWWSHDVGGLTQRDFSAARQTDLAYEGSA